MFWASVLVVLILIWSQQDGEEKPLFSTDEGQSKLSSSSSHHKPGQYGEAYSDKSYFDRHLDFKKQSTVAKYCKSLHNTTMTSIDGRAEAARKLLDQYVKEHSASTLFPYSADGAEEGTMASKMMAKDRELCESDRSFVIGTYSCPATIGAHMHEFLNAFAGAVITNRTLLWHYCDRDSCRASGHVERCDSMLQKKDWMMSAFMVTQRLVRGGCKKKDGYFPSKASTGSANRRRLMGPLQKNKNAGGGGGGNKSNGNGNGNGNGNPLSKDSHDGGTEFVPDAVVPVSRHSSDSEGLLACCGVDTLPKRIIDFGILERQEMYGLTFPGSNLGPDAAQRANVLFGAGNSHGYGLLFRHAFEFSQKLKIFNREATETLLQLKEQSPWSSRRRRRLAGAGAESPSSSVAGDAAAGGGGGGLSSAGGKWAKMAFAGNHTARDEEQRKAGIVPERRPAPNAKYPAKVHSTANDEVVGENDLSKWDTVATKLASSSSSYKHNHDRGNVDENHFVLGVHVRHMQLRDEGTKDTMGEMQCIKEMLSAHAPGYEDITGGKICTVLLASDRAATLKRLTKDIESLGCHVVIANHAAGNSVTELKSYADEQERSAGPGVTSSSSSSTASDFSSATSGRRGRRLETYVRGKVKKPGSTGAAANIHLTPKAPVVVRGTGDHGPFKDSFASIADLHLLSQAHAFIGSADSRMQTVDRPLQLSAYSMLIAELVSTSEPHAKRREAWDQKNNKKSPDSMWERWLPECGESFGSYRLPFAPAIRTPVDLEVAIDYDANKALAYQAKLERQTHSSLAVHRHGESCGSGHYESSFCSSFAWGAKCYNLRAYNDMSQVCRSARTKN
jgi:hypothetical protein